jgi:hypothetical protein
MFHATRANLKVCTIRTIICSFYSQRKREREREREKIKREREREKGNVHAFLTKKAEEAESKSSRTRWMVACLAASVLKKNPYCLTQAGSQAGSKAGRQAGSHAGKEA